MVKSKYTAHSTPGLEQGVEYPCLGGRRGYYRVPYLRTQFWLLAPDFTPDPAPSLTPTTPTSMLETWLCDNIPPAALALPAGTNFHSKAIPIHLHGEIQTDGTFDRNVPQPWFWCQWKEHGPHREERPLSEKHHLWGETSTHIFEIKGFPTSNQNGTMTGESGVPQIHNALKVFNKFVTDVIMYKNHLTVALDRTTAYFDRYVAEVQYVELLI